MNHAPPFIYEIFGTIVVNAIYTDHLINLLIFGDIESKYVKNT